MKTIDARAAFLRVFANVAEEGYGSLYDVMSENYSLDEARENFDADDIRSDLSNAISEAAELLGLPSDDPEESGELSDWITDNWPALGDYLTETTDAHLTETAPSVDPVDTAFLCIGAAEAYDAEAIGDDAEGMTGFITAILEHAPTLAELWPGHDNWHGGVWAYDVAEALGAELARKWARDGQRPSIAEGRTIARNLINRAQSS